MVPKESNVASVRSGNRFREIGHPSGNPVSSGRFPAGLGGRFAPESVAGFLWNHRPVSSGIRIQAEVFFLRAFGLMHGGLEPTATPDPKFSPE